MKALPRAPMTVSDEIGRDAVRVEETTWRTRLSNDGRFKEIAPLSAMSPLERMYAAARLNYIHREKQNERLRHALALLDHGISLTSDTSSSGLPASDLHHHMPYADLPLLMALGRLVVIRALETPAAGSDRIAPPWSSALESVVCRLLGGTDGKKIRAWADAWALSPWERISFAGAVQRCAPDPSAVADLLDPMLEEARSLVLKKDRHTDRQAVADIVWSRHLSHTGRTDEAVRLLEERLSKLPDETLSDLLPLRHTDLTRGEGGQLLRIWILEALIDLRGHTAADDARTLRELAVLQPLVETRLKRLFAASGGDLKQRVSILIGLLSGDASDAARQRSPKAARPLDPTLIERRLRHPAGREGTVLRKVGGFLAAGKTPDYGALKSYARKISPETAPELSRTLMDGAVILGMPAVEGYISFGDLDTGIRGYDAKPPFLLIGGAHTDPKSSVFMTSDELRFLVGGELAHIRFGHERITSREVWEGTFDKAMTLVELVPVLGTYLGKIGRFGGAADMVKKAGSLQNYIRRARDVAATTQSLIGGKNKDAPPAVRRGLSEDEQNLISAFRVMQLTADRVGLLLCGDAGAAVRAMFKSRPTLAPELYLAESMGLSSFLGRINEKGELLFQDLAIRLAALFSFYLSREYETLTDAAFAVIEK